MRRILNNRIFLIQERDIVREEMRKLDNGREAKRERNDPHEDPPVAHLSISKSILTYFYLALEVGIYLSHPLFFVNKVEIQRLYSFSHVDMK
jgi:hypothetical protein